MVLEIQSQILILRPEVIPLWIGMGISAYLLFIGFRYRHSAIGLDFMLLMTLVFIWQTSDAIGISTAAQWIQIILAGNEVACMAAIPVLILVFAARLTRRRRWITRGLLVSLCIVPALTAVLLLTNDYHHLVFTGYSFRTLSSGSLLQPEFGPWFLIQGVYSYFLILVALIFVFDWLRKTTAGSRGQAIILLFGILPPITLNVIHNIGVINTIIDPTPLAFSISGFILLWGFYRYGLLDIMPIAREIVIDSMHDGVIVLDDKDAVMDINPAAIKLFGESRGVLIGHKMKELINKQGARLSIELNERGEYSSIRLCDRNQIVDYDVRLSNINDNSGIVEGKVILLNDVTKQRKLEDELREHSSLDHLTGLLNRRTFFIELDKQISLACRYKYKLSVCMLDLDRFKELNDRYGHQVGDETLALVSGTIQKTVRKSDFVGRYGGDELALLLIHTGERGALALCNRITKAVSEISLPNGFQMGVSIGLTCLLKQASETGETMIGRADRALYQAKAQGRGVIVVG